MTARHHKFETLVTALLPQLYRYAYWLGHDHALAEDVVQEALLRAWRSLDSLDDESKAKSWLLTIVRREHARQFEGLQPRFVDIDEVELADTDFSDAAHADDVAEMRRLISKLRVEYREPLVLQVVLGCTCDEIAGLLNISRANVLTRLFRARRQLAGLAAEGSAMENTRELPGI